ncbi:MAG: hypothetical protein LBU66_01530 [Treponema sp.]|nr:hypothetical protein [Treponema sp.]
MNKAKTDTKAKNTQSSAIIKTPQASQALPASQMKTPASSVSTLITSLGLPKDRVSASIVSFAKFFLLPLKPELLAEIRRQVLTSVSSNIKFADMKSADIKSVDDSSVTAKNRQALSLAAAAAESKGVGLDSKGLEMYAEAVDPDWRRQRDSDGQKKKQRDKNGDDDEAAPLSANHVTGSVIEKAALESAEVNPLLYVMNKLPGKNGQQWIVLPFKIKIEEDGRDFHISIRILLEQGQGNQARNTLRHMAVDIVETGDAKNVPENRWLFNFEQENNKLGKLSVFIQQNIPVKTCAKIKNELSRLLDIPSEKVIIKASPEVFPSESGEDAWLSFDMPSFDVPWQSIDEAV